MNSEPETGEGMRIRIKRPKGTSGFSTVEVAVLALLLLIAVGGLSGSLLSSVQLSRSSEDGATAGAAMRRMAAELSGADFATVWATYNADPNDDPAGAGTAPGAFFAVAGLTPRVDDADGFVGEILFPDQETGVGTTRILREDLDAPLWGLPRDLNADGLIDGNDRSADAMMIPVTLRLQWRNASGNQQVERTLALFE